MALTVCPAATEHWTFYERILQEVVSTHCHQRHGVHRRTDPDRLLRSLLAQTASGTQPVRCPDHRPADRHGGTVPGPKLVCRRLGRPQGRGQGRGRAHLQQTIAAGHHPAWIQTQPAGAVHPGHQMPADCRGRGDAYHRRVLCHRPQAWCRPAARHPRVGRYRHLRRRCRHGIVRLDQGPAGTGKRKSGQRGHGRGHHRHHGHHIRACGNRARPLDGAFLHAAGHHRGGVPA